MFESQLSFGSLLRYHETNLEDIRSRISALKSKNPNLNMSD
ncbi:protein of unknown function [Candidatus Nitrosocosmicus franklandus]|uniref:Uncharacterized protein n=1 Tax=Candidatus Nitrosocosmicus franklandianus TaxID=1798806 RepID=A0A484IEN6_9ARCH|nr:protein of unknown function [Candidatus Nitrosocosmicus franklandus]